MTIPVTFTVVGLFSTAKPAPTDYCTEGECIPHPNWDTTGWDHSAAAGSNYVSVQGLLTIDVNGKLTAIQSILARRFATAREARTWADREMAGGLLQDADSVLVTCNTQAWEKS